MATIGLDLPKYALITEDEQGYETYGTPKTLGKAMKADLSVDLAEAILYADDGAAEVVKDFKSGKLSIGLDNLSPEAQADILGVTIDANGVVVSSSENAAPYVAVGFRAQRANGKYRYFWLYKVKFSPPGDSLATKGDSISFNTPTIEGVIMRRNKPSAKDEHPWKSEVTEGGAGTSETVIQGWFGEVYEPVFSDSEGGE